MNYTTYQHQFPTNHRPVPHSFSKVAEIAVGALLLISPMFWLFIAELIK